ncbi:MAG: winged helix-turn-helix transcriptional regulator [Chthoniobacterales bacterium]|nr:winged helix-turn-helix transcriptional regulator [Chthoniobacterales bacterium]
MARPAKRKKLSDRGLQVVARRFKVLSEPARLRLLMALEHGEQHVTALVELTDLTQGNVSKHLGILMDVGMVDRRKQGLNAFYFISDPQILDLCELMCSKLEAEFSKDSAHFR